MGWQQQRYLMKISKKNRKKIDEQVARAISESLERIKQRAADESLPHKKSKRMFARSVSSRPRCG